MSIFLFTYSGLVHTASKERLQNAKTGGKIHFFLGLKKIQQLPLLTVSRSCRAAYMKVDCAGALSLDGHIQRQKIREKGRHAVFLIPVYLDLWCY